MKKIYHRKLIRDRIPEIIKKAGGGYRLEVLTDRKKFLEELKNKLVEEAREVHNAGKNGLLKELADVLELIREIGKQEKINFASIDKLRKIRKSKRGGFEKRLYLIWSSSS